jgi:hypothetical protein
MKSVAIAAVLVCAMVATAEAADLGERGALSINGSFQLSLASVSNSETDTSSTSITVAPNADYFIVPNLSIGGGVSFNYTKVGDVDNTNIGVTGRAGYYLPLGSAGIWLQAGLAYSHGVTGYDFGLFTGTSDVDSVAVQVYVPICLHLAPGFFFGLGPVLSQDLYRDDGVSATPDGKVRILGIASMVGGVW